MDILLCGASGRMGKEVLSCAHEIPDVTPTSGFGEKEEFIR